MHDSPAKPGTSDQRQRPLRRWLAAVLVGLLPALLVAATLRDPGLTWDEAIYLGTAVRYAVLMEGSDTGDWYDFDFDSASPGFKAKYADYPRPWTAFSAPVVDFFWWQKDHPPLAKVAMAVSLRVLLFGGADILYAFRFSTVLAFAGLLFLVYLFAEKRLGRSSGLFAVLTLAMMPRVFGHAHFAALDIPMTLLWFATTFAFVKGIESRRWAAATGIVFGLALLTKINAILIPVALAPWGILYHRKKCIPNLVAMLTLAPLVFFAGWPALWRDPVERTGQFLSTAFQRTHIPVYYLGTQYTKTHPPFHYPVVLALFTLPIGTTAFAAFAAAKRIRLLKRDPNIGLILLNILVILGSASLPTAPKYDGVRLFLPLFPFVALLSAVGIRWAWDRISAARKGLAIGLAMIYFGLQAASIAWIHPCELSYYSILCGGVPGAARLGMETTYWGEVVNSRLLGYLRDNLPEGSLVEFRHIGSRVLAVHRSALGDFPGNIRETERVTDMGYVVLVVRQGMFEPQDWQYLREHKALWSESFQGVPLCLMVKIEGRK